MKSGQYTILNKGRDVKSFIDMKLLQNGELVVFDEQTSDLVKYSPELVENKRLMGKKKINLGKLVSPQKELRLSPPSTAAPTRSTSGCVVTTRLGWSTRRISSQM